MCELTPAAEDIPDEDVLSRLIEEPTQYRAEKGMIWENIFQLPRNKETGAQEGESLIWRKYAPQETDVHRLGCEREEQRKANRPDVRYLGFISAEARAIRGVQSKRGHGFRVDHKPGQGIHHAEVNYRVAVDQPLQPNDKNELKYLLKAIFSPLVPHSSTV